MNRYQTATLREVREDSLSRAAFALTKVDPSTITCSFLSGWLAASGLNPEVSTDELYYVIDLLEANPSWSASLESITVVNGTTFICRNSG